VTIPDFRSLYQNQPPVVPDSTKPVDQTTAAGGKAIPDFSQLYGPDTSTDPNDIRRRNIDGLNRLKSNAYSSIGLQPGSLRDFVDAIPSMVVDMLAATPEDLSNAAAGGGEMALGLAAKFGNNPQEAAGEIAVGAITGFVDPFVKYPLELVANKHLSYGQIASQFFGGKGIEMASGVPLTPEEREQHAKSIVGNTLAWMIGAGTEKVVAKTMVGQEAVLGRRGLAEVTKGIEEAQKAGILQLARTADDPIAQAAAGVSNRDLLNLSDKVTLPPFIRNTISGGAGGITGGAVMGAVEGSTPEERLQGAFSYAMIGAPFGVVMTTFGHAWRNGKVPLEMPELIARQAGELAKMRMIQSGIDQPLAEILFNMSTLQERQNISATLALNSLEYVTVGADRNGTPMTYGKNARIIPGVENPADILSIVAQRNLEAEHSAHAIVHTRADGLNDVLIAPAGLSQAEQAFFAKTGYAQGQQVSFGGKDNWVIENMGIPDGKRKYRMELRNLLTDERITDVKPRDITRLSSNEPGDLSIFFGRKITRDDIYDLGQGFSHGSNSLSDANIPQDINEFQDWASAQAAAYIGGYPEVRGGKAATEAVIDAQRELRGLQALGSVQKFDAEQIKRVNELLKIVKDENFAAREVYVNGKQLEPGVNFIEHQGAGEPASGAIIYMGGKEVEVPGPDGKPTKVMVGQQGEIVSVLTWSEQARGEQGRMVRGSNDFYSRAASTNRGLANEAVKAERAKQGILVSNSSLSREGGSGAMKNMRNTYAPDRQIGGRLTVDTPESLKKEILNSFLDHTGITPDGHFAVSPDDMLSSLEIGALGRTNRGESINTMFGRLETQNVRPFERRTPTVWTDTKRELTMDEARTLLREQISDNAVPTVHQQIPQVDQVPQASFNDMVNSFVQRMRITSDAAPAVYSFLQDQIGKILLGQENAYSRLSDRSTLPMLESLVERAKKQVEVYDNKLAGATSDNSDVITREKWESIRNKNQETVDVVGQRIEQLKNAEPIPFSAEERATLSRLEAEGKALREERVRDLASVAVGNGFAVDYHEGGKIVLRDRETWSELPQRFNTPDEAIDFINNTGKARGTDVDGGGNNVVPPASVMGVMPGPEDIPHALTVPHQFAPNTRVSAISRLLNTVAPWLTPKREFFVALDNTFKGSKLYSDVYLPTQTALMKLQSIRHPYYQLLNGIEKLLHGSGADRERWKVVSQYRETMSPQEVIDKMFSHRKLTATEIDYANRLVNDGIDIQNVYNYRRAVGEMRKGFEAREAELQAQMNGTQDPRAKQAASAKIVELNASHKADVESAKNAFNMDDKHLKAVDLFDEITKRDPNDVALNGVTRLARSMQNNEMSRAQFAAHHKMSGAELVAAKQLDSFYSKIAKEQDIDQSLNGYLNHFRAYTELPESTPAKLKEQVLRGAIKDSPALANELLRSGELNVYELDPIKAAVQYVNSVTNNRHFNDVWNNAYNSAVESLNKVPNGRKAASRVVEEYLYGLKGVPEAADKLAQTAFDQFMDAMGSDLRPDIRRDITSTFLAAGSGAFLGFRPAQGIRDFAQFSKLYFSRFGAQRWGNGLKLAFERDSNGRMKLQALAEDGVIPGLSVLPFLSERELSSGLAEVRGKVKDAIFAASQKGLELSGQHNAYALAHAISYLDTRDLASRTLLDLSRGKITKEIAYKRLGMNSYDIPVAEGFDRLVTDGKINEAIEYLAQSTGAETAFIFGMQNHPYGWGTVTGRIAGMFGTWSVWDRTAIMRLAGRGTAGERAAAMARFAMAETATGLTGRVLGINMRSWYMIPGMLFFGGPAFEYAQQLEDLAGMRGRQRQDLAKKQLTTFQNGKPPIIGNLIPGSSAFSDWYKAYELSNKQYGGVSQVLQAMGFSVDQTQRSLLDESLGNYPQVKP
jgi:hypothetical protein